MKNDSKEEEYFTWYADELKAAGLLKNYTRAETYILSDEVTVSFIKKMKRVEDKSMTKSILKKHVYTPDFVFEWDLSAIDILTTELSSGKKISSPFIDQDGKSIIEIKGTFDRKQPQTSINIKWMFEKHGIFVNRIVVPKIFKETFTPARYLLTDKSKQPRKLKYKPKSVQRFCLEIARSNNEN